MFKQDWTEVYLKDVWPDVDGEKRVLNLKIFVNPCSEEQAAEVHEDIADAMFRKGQPRQITHDMNFSLTINPHSMNICRSPDYVGDRIFVPHVMISKISAQHVMPGAPHWALILVATFDIADKSIIASLVDLMQEKIHVGFALLQGELPFADPVLNLKCRLCGMETPEFATTDGRFAYCQKDSINKEDGEQLRRIRNADEVSKVATEEAPADSKPPATDPLLSGSDINQRSKRKRVN